MYIFKAKENIEKLRMAEPKAYNKVQLFIRELAEHPRRGTGHPEQLKADKSGCWSRRISKKHRLVYEIRESEVVVLILTAYGHYADK